MKELARKIINLLRQDRQIENKLERILDLVESLRGDFDLNRILDTIGQELRQIDVSTVFTVYDKDEKNLIVKYYKFSFTFDLLMQIGTLPVSRMPGYQDILLRKKPAFFTGRVAELQKAIPQISGLIEEKKYLTAANSIAAPFILKGEVIGFLEMFSPRLRPADLGTIARFTHELGINISHIILFHEVKKSEERYHDLFDNAQAGFFILNGRKKCFTEVNKQFCALTGYTKQELLQMNCLRIFHPDDRETVNGYINKRLAGISDPQESPTDYEVRITDKQGQTRYIRLIISRFINQNEWFSIVHDQTERHLAKEAIRKSEAKYRSLFENMLNGFAYHQIIVDEKGLPIDYIFLEVNQAFEDLTGMRSRDIIGRRVTEVIPDLKNDGFDWIKTYGEAALTSKKIKFEQYSRPLNKWYHVSVYSPAPGYFATIFSDITERKLAEMELEKLNKELEHKVKRRTRQLEQANKRLQEILDLRSKFIADASHELRTPLTIIQGNIDLLLRSIHPDCPGENKEMLDTVNNEVEHMSGILSDLTVLSNAEAGDDRMSFEAVDLSALVETIIQSLRVLAEKKSITINYEKIFPELITLGDETKLERMLMNLVRNAIKYSDEGGWIRINLEKDEKEIKINIEDNGIGIPEKDLPYIFERFYRVDKARSRSEGGSGLGLSICKWIAETHGGYISVKSVVDQGSAFTVHLPWYKELYN